MLLGTIGLYNQTPQSPSMVNKFLELFVYKLENSSKNALEINYAWDETAKELRKNFPFLPARVMEGALQRIEPEFETAINVLVFDHSVAQEAVAFRTYSQSRLSRREDR